MDKKTIITIIIATILALVSAYLILNKNTTDKLLENVSTPQEEVSITEEPTIDKEIATKEFEQTKETSEAEKALKQTKNAVKPETSQTPVFDKVVVQQGSVVEEAEPDYGIKKVGDCVEITREFKVKSPVKYSFKDFGILDKVSTK